MDTFHVDPWNSRDNVEQRVQRRIRRNRVDLVQLGGELTNPEDRDRAVRLSWIRNTSCTTTQTCNSVRSSEVASKVGSVLETDHSRVGRAEQEITISFGVCFRLCSDKHRRGRRVFLTFPWTWNVLTTWPIQSVISEALFLCVREVKKGILTNCADTRSFGWSVSLLQVSHVSASGAVVICKPVCVPCGVSVERFNSGRLGVQLQSSRR